MPGTPLPTPPLAKREYWYANMSLRARILMFLLFFSTGAIVIGLGVFVFLHTK